VRIVLFNGSTGLYAKQNLRTPNLCFCKSRCNGARGQKQNNMLQQFTWQQFLVAAAVLTLVWYVAVILLFYRKELNAFLSGKMGRKVTDEPLPHQWEKGVEEQEETEDELMGKPALPEGMTTVSMGGIGFVASERAKVQQIGLVPDVLAEIRDVFGILEKEDGDKKDFLNLMAIVRGKYPGIGANPNIGSINAWIIEHAPFHLSPEELENLWD